MESNDKLHNLVMADKYPACLLITAFYTLLSAVFDLIVIILSFGTAWGGIESIIFSVLIGITCFFVTWFLTGIIDRYWCTFSAAVALPTLALHTEILIENLKLGHIPADNDQL